MKSRLLYLFAFAAIILFACGDKKTEKPFIIIYPEEMIIQAYNNEKMVFNIKVLSDYTLTRFIITKKYAGEQEITLLDSALYIKNFSYQWAFRTPADNTEDLYIYFKAINENGYQTIMGRTLRFYGNKFQEYTGLKMYSANSGNAAAFDLSNLVAMPLSADSLQRDIQEYQADTAYTHLSYKWVSPSKCQFVKFNDYDYGNASSTTAKSAFEAGIKLTEIANIKLNDIYIIKMPRLAPEEVYVVVKITNLIDYDGKANDFYEFSVKK